MVTTVSGDPAAELRVVCLEEKLGEALRVRTELQDALDALPRAVVLLDQVRLTTAPARLTIRYMNAHALRGLGLTRAEVEGRDCQDVLPWATGDHLDRLWRVADSRTTEAFVADDGGVNAIVEVTVAPWGEHGLLVEHQDVTDRVGAVRALRTTQAKLAKAERLADVQARSGIGTWEWDVTKAELTWSDGMYTLHGLTRDAGTPQAVQMRGVPARERAQLRSALAAACTGGGAFSTRYRVRRPDGTTVHIAGRSYVEVGQDGAPVHMWGSERDVTEEAEREALLTEQALTDPLTGLLNRRGWDAATADLGGTPTSVAVLDLDHFKAWNDSRGHAAGDALLRGSAGAWMTLLRRGDVLARLGGEEFALVLPSCGLDEARFVVDDLRRAIPGGATASAGVTLLDETGIDAALARADEALYRAKATGRNRTVTG